MLEINDRTFVLDCGHWCGEEVEKERGERERERGEEASKAQALV